MAPDLGSTGRGFQPDASQTIDVDEPVLLALQPAESPTGGNVPHRARATGQQQSPVIQGIVIGRQAGPTQNRRRHIAGGLMRSGKCAVQRQRLQTPHGIAGGDAADAGAKVRPNTGDMPGEHAAADRELRPTVLGTAEPVPQAVSRGVRRIDDGGGRQDFTPDRPCLADLDGKNAHAARGLPDLKVIPHPSIQRRPVG